MRFVRFFQLRRDNLPLMLCWQMAGLNLYIQKAVNVSALILCAVCCLYLMSDAANAGIADKVEEQKAEIKALRKIVSSCLTEGIGGPIKIGDDWFLCGITPLGKF